MSFKIATDHSKEKSDDLQPVVDIIHQTNHHMTPLQKIIQKARFLMAVDDHLHQVLPKELGINCTVMNYNNGTLVIGVANAAMATRLRFESRAILEKIRSSKQFDSIRMLQFKVRP